MSALRRRYGRAHGRKLWVGDRAPVTRVDWESTPMGALRIVLRAEREPYSKTGVAWRAYRADDATPLGIGDETRARAARRVLESYPQAILEVSDAPA